MLLYLHQDLIRIESNPKWPLCKQKVPSKATLSPKVRVACENEGCPAQMTREEIDGHLTQCLKQKIPCSDCGFWMPKEVLHEHRTSLCSYKQISSPLGCGISLPWYVYMISCKCNLQRTLTPRNSNLAQH